MTAAIVQFQKKEAAQYLCSACGADRGCNCNAPAVEKLAAKAESQRQTQRAYRERKAEEKQRPRYITHGDVADAFDALDDPDDASIEADVNPENYNTAFMIRADQARRFAAYSGQVTQDNLAMARSVMSAWTNLVQQMEVRYERKED